MNCRPKLWKRFVDDILAMVKEGSVQQLMDHQGGTAAICLNLNFRSNSP